MIEIARDSEALVMRMSVEEGERLAFALRAGYETTSRAEYWIRHGLAQGDVRGLVAAIQRAAHEEGQTVRARLETGIESEENPRRPRPQD